MKWMTKEGDILDIREMDTDHLANVAALIARQVATFEGLEDTYYALAIKKKQLKKINKELRYRQNMRR